MYGYEACVQAFLRGEARFCGVQGCVRVQPCRGGVLLQMNARNLPCGGGMDFYGLRIEGGCGCPPLTLASVPVWQGEASMTYYMGGVAAENLARREVVLYLNDPCCGRVASGVFQPCWPERPYECGMPTCRDERPMPCPPSCPPYPLRCPPLYPQGPTRPDRSRGGSTCG